ncbi:hypothetical protein B4168_2391 [Anoxybacillus flavithermus]|nr:hypothetical protein B4168_2391 [Anoxybacillus flavithermus]OAO87815.1 hypothetical protein GT23_0962 [Parageobacillus thermoglucosidasius]
MVYIDKITKLDSIIVLLVFGIIVVFLHERVAKRITNASMHIKKPPPWKTYK